MAASLVALFVGWAPARAQTVPAPSAGAPSVTCSEVIYTPATASTAQVGTLCVPSEVATDTVILLVHGGGGYEGTRTDLGAWQRFYAGVGVPTLSIDYALTGDRGEAPIYPLPEQNVKAAVEYLRLVQVTLGTDQVVVQGHSAGARLGAVALTTPDDPFFSGRELRDDVSDAIDGFIGFYGYYTGLQFDEERYYGGPEDSADALVQGRWQRADSTELAAAAVAPALLVHGADDGLVAAEQSERFGAALDAAGVDVTTRILEGKGHAFDLDEDGSLSTDGQALAPEILTWLQDHVG